MDKRTMLEASGSSTSLYVFSDDELEVTTSSSRHADEFFVVVVSQCGGEESGGMGMVANVEPSPTPSFAAAVVVVVPLKVGTTSSSDFDASWSTTRGLQRPRATKKLDASQKEARRVELRVCSSEVDVRCAISSNFFKCSEK